MNNIILIIARQCISKNGTNTVQTISTRWKSSTILPPTIQQIIASSNSIEPIVVRGWVRSVRKQKNICFAEIHDGSSFLPLQTVIDHHMANRIATGTCVQIEGILTKSPGIKQIMELQAQKLEVVGECDAEQYPLQKKKHTLEYLRRISYCRPRSKTINAMMRLRSHAIHAIHDFYREHHFVHIHTPIITSHDCEGGGEVFEIHPQSHSNSNNSTTTAANNNNNNNNEYFFNSKAYLTVSGQLHLEALTHAFQRVYTFGPTFRAEPSQTSKHLSEFWMVEAELAFVSELNVLLDFVELSFKSVTRSVFSQCSDELDFLTSSNETVNNKNHLDLILTWISSAFARITYTEAIHLLKQEQDKAKFGTPVDWGLPLASEHEHFLATKYFKAPVFVTNYPQKFKPFYMRSDSNPDSYPTVSCFDLLLPNIGELIGGSLREERHNQLLSNIQQNHLDPVCLDWYLKLREFGSVPHAGFGLGFDRYLLFLSNIKNIRDTCAFPRYTGCCIY